MESFLIKIGKAINVLKRDGFIFGLQRIGRAFLAQFRKVDDGDVLFVAGGVGDSAMYRADNVAEELDFNGILASVAYADSPFLSKYADTFKVFVFHRVAYTEKIAKFIGKIKQQKKEIIFDTDDLLYDGKFIKETDYFKNINSLEKKLFENGLGSEIVNDPYVKVCTTTTSYLAEKLREKGKKVFIVPNKLSQEDVEISNVILRDYSCHSGLDPESMVLDSRLRGNDNEGRGNDNEGRGNDNEGRGNDNEGRGNDKVNSNQIQNSKFKIQNSVKIGYFSGTPSHNKDFATITDALMEIMERHQNVEFVLAGPLDADSVLNKFNNRIVHLPYVPRESHFENIAYVDINLAPLVLNDPFCESKSELKFFEAGVVGVPTVAVANRTFSEAISDGVDGFLAKDTDEWVQKLEKLILEPNLRQKMGQKARETALNRHTTQSGKNREYYAFLKNAINKIKNS